MTKEGSLLWKPRKEIIEQAQISKYSQWVGDKYDLKTNDYTSLRLWSVKNPELFWESIWSYFDIAHEGHYDKVMSTYNMPGVRWFEGTKLNYAEHIFSNASKKQPALIHGNEQGELSSVSWETLTKQTAAFQDFLLSSCALCKGEHVVAYLPCLPQATVAFLATIGLGAVWSSCSPDFGVQAVVDRFAQLKPKIMVAVDHYTYGGRDYDKHKELELIVQSIPSIEKLVLIPPSQMSNQSYISWDKIMKQHSHASLILQRIKFNDPLWVLYSSGTTGLPKAIVHSHGGVLLEQLKYLSLHQDIHPGERCFWYTTTGWMMWNYIQGTLLCGGTAVLYDGSPIYPDANALWEFAQKAGINHFGVSASYIMSCRKNGINPIYANDLQSLRSVGSTGSVLPIEGFRWIYEYLKDVWLMSISGGADVCSAFVGGNITLPVYEGQIQCIALGCNLDVWNENHESIHNAIGEMVIKTPMPSMPIYFIDDANYKRYKKSYFSLQSNVNVWKHGDWISITKQQGLIIYGRSDATLNRGGIRIGTSEIYRALMQVEEVDDALVVCIEKKRNQFYMPLYVKLHPTYVLSSTIVQKIKHILRKTYSPRHVPDDIIHATDIPYTISGKKAEVPIKKILMGVSIEKAIQKDALRNPESMKFYIDFYQRHLKE